MCKVCVHMLGVSKVMRGRELIPVDLFVKILDLVFLASVYNSTTTW